MRDKGGGNGERGGIACMIKIDFGKRHFLMNRPISIEIWSFPGSVGEDPNRANCDERIRCMRARRKR